MTRVVLVTCTAWPNLADGDKPYKRALQIRGFDVTHAPWNDPTDPFPETEVAILRSNWDYHHQKDDFVAWLRDLDARGVTVLNPPPLVLWNLEKDYLFELAEKEILIPRTEVIENNRQAIERAFHQFGGERVVFKPTVGASGVKVLKATPTNLDGVIAELQREPRRPRLLVQEFLPEIGRDGELSCVFFDGVYSHAFRRWPDIYRTLAGDDAEREFRANGTFGVLTGRADPSLEVIDQARRVLAALPAMPLYARVDGFVRDGRFTLTELELNEPGLRMDLDIPAGERFAEATVRRLAG